MTLQKFKNIANHYNLIAIYAFGSRAAEIAARIRGEFSNCRHSGSDLDIGVQPAECHKLSAREKVQLTIDLEDLFQEKRVDLVVISEIEPFLALEIIRGELIYCEDFDAQAELELFFLRRAGDLAYYEKQRRRQILFGNE
jgi:predicted nucleotidyltransferase